MKIVRKDYLEGCITLLNLYKHDIKFPNWNNTSRACPLCNAKWKYINFDNNEGVDDSPSDGCEECPWMLFEGIKCYDWKPFTSLGLYGYSDLRSSVIDDPRLLALKERRIAMLERWISESVLDENDES